MVKFYTLPILLLFSLFTQAQISFKVLIVDEKKDTVKSDLNYYQIKITQGAEEITYNLDSNPLSIPNNNKFKEGKAIFKVIYSGDELPPIDPTLKKGATITLTVSIGSNTAGASSKPLEKIGANIISIKANQIVNQGYRNLAEVLASVEGFYVLFDGYQYNAGIRGINSGLRSWSRPIKIMIDGQPVSFDPTAENFLGEELIPLNIIERIDIVRGPGAVFYGRDALMGVVNIITKKTTDAPSVTIQAHAATPLRLHKSKRTKYSTDLPQTKYSTDLQQASLDNVSAQIPLKKAGGLVLAYNNSNTNFSGSSLINMPNKPNDTIWLSNFSTNEIRSTQSVFGKWHLNKKHWNISVDGTYRHLNSSAIYMDWAVPLSLTDSIGGNSNHIAIQQGYVRGIVEDTISPKNKNWKLIPKLSAVYAGSGPTLDDELHISNQTTLFRRNMFAKNWQIEPTVKFTSPKFNAIGGYNWLIEKQNLLSYSKIQGALQETIYFDKTNTQTDSTYVQHGVFIDGDYTVSEHFIITGGFRYDKHPLFDGSPNGTVAFVFPFKEFNAKFIGSSAYKSPSYTQLYSPLLTVNDVKGNPDLDLEKSLTGELVLQYKHAMKKNNTITGNFCAYYTNLSNLVVWEKNLLEEKLTAENLGTVNSIGGEASVVYQRSKPDNSINWLIKGSYSFQNSFLEKQNIINNPIAVPTRLFPQSMIKLTGVFNYKKSFTFAGHCYYISGVIASDQNIANYVNTENFNAIKNEEGYKLDPYFLLNFNVIYHVPPTTQLDVFIRLNNLQIESQTFPGFKNYDLGGFGTTLSLGLRCNLINKEAKQ